MRAKTSQKKQHIIEQALQLYHQHGVESTTIDMVCTAAEISVGSFYHHFGSKEGLAAAVYIAGLDIFSTQLWQALQACTTIQQAVNTIVGLNIDWICQNQVWAKFVFEQRHLVGKAGQEETLQQSNLGLQSKMKQFLLTLQGVEVLAALPKEIIISLLVGPVHEYARHWLNGRYQTDLIQLKPHFCAAAWASLQIKVDVNTN